MYKVWYVMAKEFRRKRGLLFPNTALLPLTGIFVTHQNNLVVVKGNNGRVTLHRDDVLRLDNFGNIKLVPGPFHFRSGVEKIIAQTKLSIDLVKISNKGVTANFQNNVVLFNGENYPEEFPEQVDRGYGKLILIYSDYETDNPLRRSYKEIIVRPGYENDPEVITYLTTYIYSVFRNTPSGIFAKKKTAKPEVRIA